MTDAQIAAITNAWNAYYAINGAPDGCTSFTQWFFKTYVDANKLKYGAGDGGDIAYNISIDKTNIANGVTLSKTPVVPGVFGARDSAWHCVATYGGPGYESYPPHGRGVKGGYIGHTGIIVKIDGNTARYLSYYSGALHLDSTVWNAGQTVDFISLGGDLKNL